MCICFVNSHFCTKCIFNCYDLLLFCIAHNLYYLRLKMMVGKKIKKSYVIN